MNYIPNRPMPTLLSDKAIIRLVQIAEQTPAGNFVEVGVYKGGSAWHLTKLAQKQSRQIYLYDTFDGIPYKNDIDLIKIGTFKDTSYEVIRDGLPYANVVKGVFPESAVEMNNIAFVHLDCDQYKAIIDSVNYLVPLMVNGGIILFDDYNWLDGATLAVNELFGKDNLLHVGAPHGNLLDRVYTIIRK